LANVRGVAQPVQGWVSEAQADLTPDQRLVLPYQLRCGRLITGAYAAYETPELLARHDSSSVVAVPQGRRQAAYKIHEQPGSWKAPAAGPRGKKMNRLSGPCVCKRLKL